ncbi:MAG: GrpB family protein [Planctomycetota bacterium]
MTANLKKTLQQRIEQAVREEVAIVPYNPEWPKLFEDEANSLRAKLPKSIIIRIEHFGSTAVPGLAAKPIIDMLVEVSSLEETKKQVVPILESQGYDYFWRPELFDGPPVYAWFIKRDSQGKRTHHIHMIEADSKLWNRLYFRDYLCRFPEEARRYNKLKRALAEKYPNDRVTYTKGKTDFIVCVTEKARQYYNET